MKYEQEERPASSTERKEEIYTAMEHLAPQLLLDYRLFCIARDEEEIEQ